MNFPSLWFFIKFCLVGATGFILDFSITYLCKEKLKWNKFLSNSLGFICAATSNYIFNRVWTFQSHNQNVGEEYSKFFIIALIGLVLNNLLIYILNSRMNFNFYLSKLLAVGIVTVWNFLMNFYFTFYHA